MIQLSIFPPAARVRDNVRSTIRFRRRVLHGHGLRFIGRCFWPFVRFFLRTWALVVGNHLRLLLTLLPSGCTSRLMPRLFR
jgi:hypothetical protein